MADILDLKLWTDEEFDLRLNEFKNLEFEFQNLTTASQMKSLEKIAIVLMHSPNTYKEEYFQLFKRLTKYKYDHAAIIQAAFIAEMKKCVDEYLKYTDGILSVPRGSIPTVLPDFRDKSHRNIAKMNHLLKRLEDFKKFVDTNF